MPGALAACVPRPARPNGGASVLWAGRGTPCAVRRRGTTSPSCDTRSGEKRIGTVQTMFVVTEQCSAWVDGRRAFARAIRALGKPAYMFRALHEPPLHRYVQLSRDAVRRGVPACQRG